MAQCISIGASSHIELVRGRLKSDLEKLEGRGMKLKIEESPAGRFTFLSCSVVNDSRFPDREEETLSLFKSYIADVLSDLIIFKWQKALLVDIIRENYYYFGEAERHTIFQNALRYLEDSSAYGSIIGIRKKRKILSRIKDFLNSGNLIVVDGFIRFRMKDYIRELQEAADKAVDDFLLDKEYQEFIQLLKYFVDIQDSKTDLINVVMKPNGSFKLFDGQKRAVNSDYLEGFIVDLIESEINYEDLLISALITIAPREIVFHAGKTEGPQNTLDTIRNIFSDRVTLCLGCDLCSFQN